MEGAKWRSAGKINPESMEELPTPFIALTRNKQAPIAIVTDVANGSIIRLQHNYNREESISKDEFFREWDGSYLIAEPGKDSGEADYAAARKRHMIATLIPVLTFGVFAVLAVWALGRSMSLSGLEGYAGKAGVFIQYFLSIAGVIVSTALLWYEMDRNNPLLKKVCTGIKNGNCGAILTSKASKAFGAISWSEIGFFYFTGATLSMTLAGATLSPILSIIALLNVLAIAYPFYSIYYQWRIAKQWCILCLLVQVLLVVGFINVFAFDLLSMQPITIAVLLHCSAMYIIPTLAWYTAKPYLLRLQEAKSGKRELQRLKYDREIFTSLLKRQKQVSIPIENLGIDLGNPEAKNIIIKVCNPYCGPCSKVHPEIEKLVKEVPDLKVKIVFTTANNEEHHAFGITRHLLALSSLVDIHKMQEAFDTWYNDPQKDYNLFASKYPLNGELMLQGSKIERMYNWCKQMDIEFTPTIFVNGYQLPNAYNVGDIRYFLLE